MVNTPGASSSKSPKTPNKSSSSNKKEKSPTSTVKLTLKCPHCVKNFNYTAGTQMNCHEEHKKHVLKCNRRLEECPNIGCTTKVNPKNMALHKEVCTFGAGAVNNLSAPKITTTPPKITTTPPKKTTATASAQEPKKTSNRRASSSNVKQLPTANWIFEK